MDRSRRIRRALRKAALGVVFAWAALAALFFLADGIYHEEGSVSLEAPLPEVDVIVCLAGGRGRITEASSIWYEYYRRAQASGSPRVPVLYLSGIGAKTSWSAIQAQFRPQLAAVIQREQVVLENESANTVGNAEWFARAAKERGWNRVLLVTSKYHLRRSRLIFVNVLSGEIGADLRLHTFSVSIEPFEAKRWWFSWQGVQVTFEEYVKYLYYRTLL